MQRGQCLSIHLLVSGLPRLQSQLCLIQIEAKDWDGYMDSLTDSIFFPHTPRWNKKKVFVSNNVPKDTEPLQNGEGKTYFFKKGGSGVSVKQPTCLHDFKALCKAKCYIYRQRYLRNQRTWPPQTQPIS